MEPNTMIEKSYKDICKQKKIKKKKRKKMWYGIDTPEEKG